MMRRTPKASVVSPMSTEQAQREAGSISLLKTIVQDLRFALRQLRRSPGFTFTAVVVFALGIAASTAIFAFVDAALVKPLPYRDPSQLVALFERIPVGDRFHLSYGDYLDWKHLNRVFGSLDVYRPDRFTLRKASGAEEVAGATVSDGFFRTLGVKPILGRDFRPGEDQPSAQQTVLLSYKIWQLRFSASQSALGQTLTLDGVPSLVIGILPPDFHFAPVASADYWTTLHWIPKDPRYGAPYYGVARLKDGVSVASAYADLASIAEQIAVAYPRSNGDRSATVIPLVDAIVGDIRPTLVALLSGAGLLSLVGFVNVSSLLLVRAESRRRESAIRAALGASRGRLVRQFAVEGFLLAGAGCAVGLLLTFCAVGLLPGLIPPGLLDHMPYLRSLHLNGTIVLFALMISIAGGTLFSVAPALQLVISDMQAGLMEGGRTAAGRSCRRMGSSLVAVELAITVVLLVSAGLLAKSFYRLLHEDIGISVDHLAVLHVVDPDNASTESHLLSTERQIRNGMAALPGVISDGTSEGLAVDNGESYPASFEHFRVVGRFYIGQGDKVIRRAVSVGYFETLRARLLQGRYFAELDDMTKPRVALINRTMARQAFPGEDPVGKSVVGEFDADRPVRVIGVIDDIKDGPLDAKQIAAVYMPLNQNPTNDLYVTLRTSQPEATMLPAMVRAVHQISGGLIADGEDTMANRINSSEAAYLHRSAAWIVAAFAALALLLGTVGLYGVVSYSVGQRTREIGVRMALGAQRSGVYRLILMEACWLTTLGVAGGILSSFAAAGLLRRMLYGVGAWDIATLLSVICMLTVSSLVASYIPARRAASIEPTEALRAE
jgi:macrolide transport system ATP-binding/permease protein